MTIKCIFLFYFFSLFMLAGEARPHLPPLTARHWCQPSVPEPLPAHNLPNSAHLTCLDLGSYCKLTRDKSSGRDSHAGTRLTDKTCVSVSLHHAA